MAQVQPSKPNSGKPSLPPPVKAKSTRVRRVTSSHEGTVSVYKFVDGSGTVHVDYSKLPSAIQAKLIQTGLTRILTAGEPTKADLDKHVTKLLAGVWAERSSQPKRPDALSEALANLSKARGQGTLPADKFAKMCSVEFWQERCFGERGMSKAQRLELRADNDVQAEIRKVKAARLRADGKAEAVNLEEIA